MIGLKTKILKQTYLDSCNNILESDLDNAGKLAALMTYASQFEIGTETEVFNELLHSKKIQ